MNERPEWYTPVEQEVPRDGETTPPHVTYAKLLTLMKNKRDVIALPGFTIKLQKELIEGKRSYGIRIDLYLAGAEKPVETYKVDKLGLYYANTYPGSLMHVPVPAACTCDVRTKRLERCPHIPVLTYDDYRKIVTEPQAEHLERIVTKAAECQTVASVLNKVTRQNIH